MYFLMNYSVFNTKILGKIVLMSSWGIWLAYPGIKILAMASSILLQNARLVIGRRFKLTNLPRIFQRSAVTSPTMLVSKEHHCHWDYIYDIIAVDLKGLGKRNLTFRVDTMLDVAHAWANKWMDGWVKVLRPFNSISVISRRWEGEHERLCALKHRLGSERISLPAGFEPATPWSEVGSANRLATRTLQQMDVQTNGWKVGFLYSVIRTEKCTGSVCISIILTLKSSNSTHCMSGPLAHIAYAATTMSRNDGWLLKTLSNNIIHSSLVSTSENNVSSRGQA